MSLSRPSKERSARAFGNGKSKPQNGSTSSTPEVRLSAIGSVVLPAAFTFEPIDPSSSSATFAQAGGRDASFKHHGSLLEKTVTDPEALFYERASQGGWPSHFLPRYAGRTGTGSIRIENLTHGLAHPCVLDLKMGVQTATASEKGRFKRMMTSALDSATGSRKQGVRVDGLTLSRTLEGRRTRATKKQVHAVSANAGVSLQDVITFFLSDADGVRTDVALRFQAHLEAILYHFKKYNNKHMFVGSSILLVYDNDNASARMRWARALKKKANLAPDTLAALTRRTAVDVRMIDFAHVEKLPVGQARDFGYMQGLQTILAALRVICAARSAPIFSITGAAADAHAEMARAALEGAQIEESAEGSFVDDAEPSLLSSKVVSEEAVELSLPEATDLGKAAREVRPDESFVAGSLSSNPEATGRLSRTSLHLGRRPGVEHERPGRRISPPRSAPPPLLSRLSRESARRRSGEKRTGHIVTLMEQKAPDGANLSASGLPAVRLSQAGNRVLPSTFRFEPVDDSRGAGFDQAGGHDGAFTVKGPVLEKAVMDREAKFYELARDGEWPEQLLPKFHGRTNNGRGIHIENLTHGFERPCVMDLKMGFHSVEESEKSLLKKMKHAALDKVTGSAHSGVRLEGMSLYRSLEKKRMKGTKAQSHSVSAHMGISLQDVLTFFLTDESGVRTDIALRFQAHIEGLLYHFKKFNNKHLFIGSSILLLYDNDNESPHMRWARALQRSHSLSGGSPLAPDTLAGLTRRTRVDVRMIDFAHVDKLPVGQARDFGYIEGLKTILTALKAIRAHRSRPIFSMARAALDAQAEIAKGSSSISSPSEDSAFNFGALYEQCSRESCDGDSSPSANELPSRQSMDFSNAAVSEPRQSVESPAGSRLSSRWSRDSSSRRSTDSASKPSRRKSSEKRKGHIVTFMGQKAADGVNLSSSGLPAVRLSDAGNRVLPSTFRFEPVEASHTSDFDQAGGHEGSFTTMGNVLEKTVTDREAKFYELAESGGWPAHFLPKYHGRTKDGNAIRIENLTREFEKPCVMDLKMGFHSVEKSEKSLLKKMKHAALDKVTGSAHSGVRLEGMSLYRSLEKKRMKGTKSQSHTVSAAMGVSLQDVLTFFLTDESGVRTDIALRFQAHIEGLLYHFKKFNNKHLFIGSSILLLYDNDNQSPYMRWARALQRSHTLSGASPLAPDTLASLTRRTKVDVRMIDFAHVGPLPVGEARDFGYIQGLQTILEALKAIRSHRSRPIFDIASAALDAQSNAARRRAEGDSPDGSVESLPTVSEMSKEDSGVFTFDSLYAQCSKQMPSSAIVD